jgi:hypothetical protein
MASTRNHRFDARRAHNHELYELAVQDVENEVDYLDRLFRRQRGRRPLILREDFCGTASLCCAWVRRHPQRLALGVDLDRGTLAWGRRQRLAQLEPVQRQRVSLVRANVLDVCGPPVDILVALNFSYWVFKTRELMCRYFRTAYAALEPDGMLVLDAYGGSEAQEVLQERRRCRGFTFVWEHADFNPITNETLCHIHFEFPDGSRRPRAFTYDWRLWSLPELQEMLADSGFSSSEVHWEGTDRDTGRGNGVFRRTRRGEAIESWIAYVVALK